MGRTEQTTCASSVSLSSACPYGGLYDEGSPLSDERDFRRDVLELLRDCG